jgi:hypothetical protein
MAAGELWQQSRGRAAKLLFLLILNLVLAT